MQCSLGTLALELHAVYEYLTIGIIYVRYFTELLSFYYVN